MTHYIESLEKPMGAYCGINTFKLPKRVSLPKFDGTKSMYSSGLALGKAQGWNGCLDYILDQIIDSGVLMSIPTSQLGNVGQPETNEIVPPRCRQRLQAENKPYPRSYCEVCGKLAPQWKECDAILAKSNSADKTTKWLSLVEQSMVKAATPMSVAHKEAKERMNRFEQALVSTPPSTTQHTVTISKEGLEEQIKIWEDRLADANKAGFYSEGSAYTSVISELRKLLANGYNEATS